MNQKIEQVGGIELAINQCDRMYDATFRSEPFPLASTEDWEEEATSLKIDLAVKLYLSATGRAIPKKPDYDACERESDGYSYEMEALESSAEYWLEKNHPDININGNDLIVIFSNYKGETDGIGLYVLNKHLPVFTSKRDSFNAVNH